MSSDTTSTENTSLLDRRRGSRSKNYNTEGLSIPLPSPFREQEPLAYPTSSNNESNTLHNRFKWFNKRTGSYDEDRQGLVKENTGIRVWSESYSSIGKVCYFNF
jgi:chloride channel 3/4/5